MSCLCRPAGLRSGAKLVVRFALVLSKKRIKTLRRGGQLKEAHENFATATKTALARATLQAWNKQRSTYRLEIGLESSGRFFLRSSESADNCGLRPTLDRSQGGKIVRFSRA
jgi:hypothetical protein